MMTSSSGPGRTGREDEKERRKERTMKKTNLENLRELRSYANFERFGATAYSQELRDLATDLASSIQSGKKANGAPGDAGQILSDLVRATTHLYRESWTNPIIDELIEREIEDRFARAEKSLASEFPNRAKTIFVVGDEIVERRNAIAFGVDGVEVRICRIRDDWKLGETPLDSKTIG